MQAILLVAAVVVVAYFMFFRKPLPEGSSLSVSQAQERLAVEKDLQLLDVRTHAEYNAGHLSGARLIPLQELHGRLGELDKSKPVLVYCRSGHRSAMALSMLLNAEFKAVHMQSGILGWQGQAFPIEK